MRDENILPETLATQYAPAARAPISVIFEQNNIFNKNKLLCQVVDAVPEIILILNKERQIIFANHTVISLLDSEDLKTVLGMRPGELLNCEHSNPTAGGCGTTEFCQTCGAVNAILASQKGIADVQECRITQKESFDALDLRVYATPLKIEGNNFTIFSISDISHEKRRKILEKIFLHDIINTAGSLHGAAQLLMEAEPEQIMEYKEIILHLSESLLEEMAAQREIAAAEANELKVELNVFNSLELLNEISHFYSVHKQGENKLIQIDSDSVDITIRSDRVLMRRVLGNMIKNALEASQPGEAVTAGCRFQESQVSFWIHNDSFIPRLDQLQIFRRSFTTRGTGRGIGTYSIKLLTEKYLKGKSSFISSKENGTIFTVTYPLDLLLTN
ncbi:MAG: PAS domain-containing sensor histidine kinase [Ignavibacteriaceae bacterium]|nr:PAS domain-containing sensor histidine kinase [Ignavibacteriaceae bacterium]